MRRMALVMVAVMLAGRADAQATIRGTVRATHGPPVAGANVFLVETLDGALSDSAGRFSFSTSHTGRALLVVKAPGRGEVRRGVDVPVAEPLAITMPEEPRRLAPTTVVASRYAASDERGATLSTLDVVATPGTNADVMRAIQTLPGVQGVDEGTALYVRGGDHLETQTLVNDAVLATAFSHESPNGTFTGTVDPFLLDGIHFSSGGFGARHGNALSGVAALTTLGVPRRATGTVTAGLAAVSAAAALPVTRAFGVRVAANQFDTDVLFRVNGSAVRYAMPPRGHDRSGSAIWRYRPTGELKVFGIAQATSLAAEVADPSFTGAYRLDLRSHLAVANWRDVVGRWSPSARVSDTRLRRAQEYGAFLLETGQRVSGASGQLDWAATGALTLRGGAEWERLRADLAGSLPDAGHDKRPGARVTTVRGHPDRDRGGLFAEADALVGARTRIVAGVRRDRGSPPAAWTVDPRASAAVTVVPGLVLTAAWGTYHQLPDALLADSTLGDPALPAMRATHAIVGMQAGSAGRMLRVELYDKRYADLAQVTRDYAVAGGGTGRARGVDVFLAGRGIPGMSWRVALSRLVSRRTDPHTGTMAPAPSDVPVTATTVVTHMLTPAWHLGLTHRVAAGRPFTPVAGATFDAADSVWVPRYGAPMSERLPSFHRLDLGLTRLQRVGAYQGVFFLSINNLLDRENIHAYRHSTDYSARFPIRSLFKRSVYVGASLGTP